MQLNKKKILGLLLLIITGAFLFAGIAYPEDKKGSAVQGRVVNGEGKSLSGVKVVAMLPGGQYKEGYNWLESRTKSNGMFVIDGLYPGMYYRIVFDGGQCNDLKDRIRSLPFGETMKLKKDYVITLSTFNVSEDGVIRDLLTGLEWAPLSVITVNYYERAESYATSRRIAGGGWRLPTLDELEDLHETGQRGCGLEAEAFGTRYPKVWASDRKSRLKQWIVTFRYNKVDTELWDPESDPCDDCRVLVVRSPKR